MINGSAKPNDWRDFSYYPTDMPCIVCKKPGKNGIEPRFGYTVCEKHSNIPPAYIDLLESYDECL